MERQHDAGRDSRLAGPAGNSRNRHKKRHRCTPPADDGDGGRSREAYRAASGIGIAIQLGYDPLPFLIALIMAANSSLATPIGSSVNMLVYGPGGYHFSDFLRIGLPVKVAFLAVSILFVIIVYPLTPLHSS